uniref:Uncharacterized protein n=1 Tax=Arundo donax TaxID=35708 RepID=A0A0A9GNP2_ARUDO
MMPPGICTLFSQLLRRIYCKNFMFPIPSGSLDISVDINPKYLRCLSSHRESTNASILKAIMYSIRSIEKLLNESWGLNLILLSNINVLNDFCFCITLQSNSFGLDPFISIDKRRIFTESRSPKSICPF